MPDVLPRLMEGYMYQRSNLVLKYVYMQGKYIEDDEITFDWKEVQACSTMYDFGN